MKRIPVIFPTLLIGFFMVGNANAQGKPMNVKVAEMFGPATYSNKGSPPRKVTSGIVLSAGTVIRTGPRAALDLQFDTGEIVRMTQNTVLEIDRAIVFRREPFVELNLKQGTILGRVNKLPTQARFDVKVGNGLLSVREGTFRANHAGYLVLLRGHMLFAFVGADQEPSLHTLKAPPPIYFSPLERIRPAPSALVNEVEKQVRARLR